MKTIKLDVDITQEDMEAAAILGAKGTELIERSIHGRLDAQGVPRQGRSVEVTEEHIAIELPPGYRLEDDPRTLDLSDAEVLPPIDPDGPQAVQYVERALNTGEIVVFECEDRLHAIVPEARQDAMTGMAVPYNGTQLPDGRLFFLCNVEDGQLVEYECE